MINKTGFVIAIYKDGKFVTIEPDGKAAWIKEHKSETYESNGCRYIDVGLGDIENLPAYTGEEIIVNKMVAIYGWSIGRDDLIYLDGKLAIHNDQTVASQTLARKKTNSRCVS